MEESILNQIISPKLDSGTFVAQMSEISVLVLIFGPAFWDLSFCFSLGIDRVDLEKGDENAKQYELFLL